MAMDDQNTPAPATRSKRRWGRRVLAAVLFTGLGGVLGFGAGMHKAAGMFWHGMEEARLHPERVAEHVDRAVDRVLSRVDATAEQKSNVSAIAKSAVTDLAGLGLSHRETSAKVLALLRADKIEPEAFEALRVEQTAKWDAASKRISQAFAEAAAFLTPEQRRELTERWARHASR